MIKINTINQRLKALRHVLNLTLKDFGATIGISISAYSDIEKGRNNLTERNKNLICKAFNVNPAWLDTGIGEMFVEPKNNLLEELAKQYNLDDFGKNIILAYAALGENERKAVKKFIKSIIDGRASKAVPSKTEPFNETTADLTLNELYKRKKEAIENLKNEPAL